MRVAALAVVSLIAFGFVACGGNEPGDEPSGLGSGASITEPTTASPTGGYDTGGTIGTAGATDTMTIRGTTGTDGTTGTGATGTGTTGGTGTSGTTT